MENTGELDLEILDKELKPFVYKWTKGDLDGQICEYENVFKDPTTGIIWMNFKGGTRINYELLNEYMMQLDTSALKGHPALISPVIANREAANIIPTKNVMLADTQLKKQEDNPIVTLLQKQKPNWVEVGIKLKLNLPTKSLYTVLTSSFEDADKEIIEFVVSDLDIEIIKESLRINIKEIYKSNGTIRKSGGDNPSENQE